MPQCDLTEKTALDSPISLNECEEALKTMPENKSPGQDGLSYEFYKTLWPTIGPIFHKTLQYSLNKGELSLSQRRAVITLLQKRGKNEAFIKNWRPISLLNCDYKILTKIISRRIQPLLPKLIHPDQVGFVPNRFIGENIRYIEDLIDYCSLLRKKCIILNIDIEKAFDTLEWDFIFFALKKYNFGPKIIKWIKTCYQNIFSTVINNGFTSGWFGIYRGVRQGCSLSCILFILSIEIMASLIRNNTNITGITIGKHERKLVQFADDTSCILENIKSVENLFSTLKYFSKFSGLKLNMEKSILFWVGTWKTPNIPQNIQVTVEHGSINVLGISVGYDNAKNTTENFTKKLAAMKNKFNIWSFRNLTLIGRINISKAIGISNFIYSMTMTETPLNILHESQTIINRFLWNNKPPRVKHKSHMASYEQCGLKAPDMVNQYKALRLAWLARFSDTKPWCSIANIFFDKYGGLDFLKQCNYDLKSVYSLPPFYKNLMLYLKEIYPNPESYNIIWNNKDITIEVKSICCINFMRCIEMNVMI